MSAIPALKSIGISDATIDEKAGSTLAKALPWHQLETITLSAAKDEAGRWHPATRVPLNGSKLPVDYPGMKTLVSAPELEDLIVQILATQPELAELADEDGTSLYEHALAPVRHKVDALGFFAGRYDLGKGRKAEPKYKSPTCRIHVAGDHGGGQAGEGDEPQAASSEAANGPEEGAAAGESVAVAMKFMPDLAHLETELRARIGPDGKACFDGKYVLGHVRWHLDEVFQQEAAARGLPAFCIVLELGGRNLAQAVLAEDISGDLGLIRPILQQLAACLDHIHGKGFVHCDFKMKNAIRKDSNGHWMAIDFDAATPFGEPLGAKASTAICPPEMVEMRDGKPTLLALQSVATEEDPDAGAGKSKGSVVAKVDVLTAHPSFDS
jgi:hypothetical protein